ARPRAELDLEAGAPVVGDRGPPRAEGVGPPTDEGLRLLGPEGAAPGEEAHRLEQARLALGVAPEEHVQPRRELEAGPPDVPQILDLHPPHPHVPRLHRRIGITTYRDSLSPPCGRNTPCLSGSFSSIGTASVPATPRKSSRYWALNPISTPSPLYSAASDSRASPRSGDDAARSRRSAPSVSLTARLRSEDRRLTRRMAVPSCSRPRFTTLSPLTAMTFSKAGNWPSMVLDASVRPPATKTRWFSTCWKTTVSSSSSRRASSWMALRGTSTRWASPRRSGLALCA